MSSRQSGAPNPSLSHSPEAVAYIGGGSKRSVSRRLICRGALPEGLRTAHFVSRSDAGPRRRTYATTSPACTSRRRGQAECWHPCSAAVCRTAAPRPLRQRRSRSSQPLLLPPGCAPRDQGPRHASGRRMGRARRCLACGLAQVAFVAALDTGASLWKPCACSSARLLWRVIVAASGRTRT
jgi:hypothetical protein